MRMGGHSPPQKSIGRGTRAQCPAAFVEEFRRPPPPPFPVFPCDGRRNAPSRTPSVGPGRR